MGANRAAAALCPACYPKAALITIFCIYKVQSGKQASVKWTPGSHCALSIFETVCVKEIFIERRTSEVGSRGEVIGLSMTRQLWPN